MTQQAPIKVTKLPKYKKELIKDIVNQSKFMLKDVFPHLNNQDYEIATYTYSHLCNLQIYFNEKLVVSGGFPRIDRVNNVVYPADNVSYITSKLYQLTKNTYKGVGLYAAQIGFNPTLGGLRVVASDGTRYKQQ